MYSFWTLLLLISSAFGHGCSQCYGGHSDYYLYEDFGRLVLSVTGSDWLAQISCSQHNYRTTVTSGDGYYILKYYLDNIVEDSVVIMIHRRVIYVKANLGNGTVYKNLKILPDHLLVDGALWKIIDGNLNVIIGSKLRSGKEVDLTCGGANENIIVRKAPLSPEDL
ncbi:hypothetical protein RR46_12191 [Papilio xuthus]|uniref:Uncharacterized protein n=1 Tax=Papilio xuthus TaxID=66420 RepID=A0A194PPF1_PAPXU|nr:hypothetical protein RR46_12191 [Papilio xuthus]